MSSNGKELRGDDRLAVSVVEASRLVGISRGLGYELVKRGELPCARIGGRVVVPVAGLRAWLASRTTGEVAAS